MYLLELVVLWLPRLLHLPQRASGQSKFIECGSGMPDIPVAWGEALALWVEFRGCGKETSIWVLNSRRRKSTK